MAVSHAYIQARYAPEDKGANLRLKHRVRTFCRAARSASVQGMPPEKASDPA